MKVPRAEGKALFQGNTGQSIEVAGPLLEGKGWFALLFLAVPSTLGGGHSCVRRAMKSTSGVYSL